MDIYQSNTYRKDLSWLHFNDEARVQERQQVKDQQSFLSNNSKKQLGAPAQTWRQYSIHNHMADLLRYRATSGERNSIEQIKAIIFLEAALATETVQEFSSNLKEEVNPSILKDDFSSRADLLISHQ